MTNQEELTEAVEENIEHTSGIITQLSETVFSEIKVDGYSLEDWEQKFTLEIPQNLSPDEIRQLLSRLIKMYQTASYYKNKHSLLAKVSTTTQERKLLESYSSLFSAFERKANAAKALLNRSHFEKLAKKENTVFISATLIAEGIETFWSNILKKIEFSTNVLKIAAMSNGTEVRMHKHD